MPRDDATLLDIARASQLVLDFTKGISRDAFRDDLKTQSAVMHQLLIIGEAAKRLSNALRESHKEIPWSLIAGMRDRLIHGYDAVDLDEVWQTLQKDVPELIDRIRPLLPT